MSPRVTVLMPVYNGEAHLREAVGSILAQTFTDFELLAIDDCSTDGSAELLASYGDERVRLIRNEHNLGQVATLNRGLREALGELVARLDQDDIMLPARLERQVAFLDANPRVALVATWMDFVDPSGRVIWELRDRLDDFPELIYLILTDELPLPHPTVMFRREPVLALGGYDEAVRYAEDRDLWRRLALERHEARMLPELLVRYRVHEGQQSRTSADAQRQNNEQALERFIATLEGRVSPPAVRRLLGGDGEIWRELSHTGARDLARSLELLLEGGARRLQLAEAERVELERRVRSRVHLLARRSWRVSVAGHWRAAGPLLRFGGPAVAPSTRRRARLAYACAPILRALLLPKTAGRSRGPRTRAA